MSTTLDLRFLSGRPSYAPWIRHLGQFRFRNSTGTLNDQPLYLPSITEACSTKMMPTLESIAAPRANWAGFLSLKYLFTHERLPRLISYFLCYYHNTVQPLKTAVSINDYEIEQLASENAYTFFCCDQLRENCIQALRRRWLKDTVHIEAPSRGLLIPFSSVLNKT